LNLSLRFKVSFIISCIIICIFAYVKTLVLIEYWESTKITRLVEYICFLSFLPVFYLMVKEILAKTKIIKDDYNYIEKLNEVLIKQSHNSIFYKGDTVNGAKELTLKVTECIDADRCSIWLYQDNKMAIHCEQLYVRSENQWYQGLVLNKSDFDQYFLALEDNPIIIANDAETHPSTSCFTEGYLKPLGIKSMLDVPIVFKGETIGVVCIESFSKREWKISEVNFAQNLSSLYSFAYSVFMNESLKKDMIDLEKFLQESAIVSKADSKGKITYINEKFTQVSGYTLDEVVGKDHNIVNSGEHPKEFWTNMYKTVIKDKKTWNNVCINRAKDGSIYYVDTFIKANFNQKGDFLGFMSIRQDITDIKRKEVEISNRMDAINRSNAVIEFDLEGNIKFANDSFIKAMGYTSHEELAGKHHSMFIEDELKDTQEYKEFWEGLRKGIFFSGEIIRKKKDGKLIYLRATYNPIIGVDGKVYRIMKVATDITEGFLQKLEIEKKNTYLEHAAKILRHDMHSGINTYMPRGLSSLDRRMSDEQAKELKIDAPLRMIKEGLRHTQKVYKGVYEFTNLVKKDVVLNKSMCNLKDILEDYLSATAYRPQVIMEDLGEADVNESLFCTSIDNLIRNGLKYNDSASKFVKIYRVDNLLYVEDNGRGLSQSDFDQLSKPYVRKKDQKESGSGLGLNICIAILEEHGFSITCDKLPTIGTQIKININQK
jgi:PAS domain S-box-containing protein